MDVQNDKDFAALPEVAKLYQACKERDLTIAEREYLKGARDAWQVKAQAVPEGFVLISKNDLKMELCSIRHLNSGEYSKSIIEDCVCNIEAMIEAQEPAND